MGLQSVRRGRSGKYLAIISAFHSKPPLASTAPLVTFTVTVWPSRSISIPLTLPSAVTPFAGAPVHISIPASRLPFLLSRCSTQIAVRMYRIRVAQRSDDATPIELTAFQQNEVTTESTSCRTTSCPTCSSVGLREYFSAQLRRIFSDSGTQQRHSAHALQTARGLCTPDAGSLLGTKRIGVCSSRKSKVFPERNRQRPPGGSSVLCQPSGETALI